MKCPGGGLGEKFGWAPAPIVRTYQYGKWYEGRHPFVSKSPHKFGAPTTYGSLYPRALVGPPPPTYIRLTAPGSVDDGRICWRSFNAFTVTLRCLSHREGDRVMARVNYYQPPGCSRHRPVSPLFPARRPVHRCLSVVGVRVTVRPPVRPCRFSAERHSLAITHLGLIQLLVMVWLVRRLDARSVG